MDTSVPKISSLLNDSYEFYATVPGYGAWRNKIEGSYFIRTFCNIFQIHAKDKEIMDMFQMVVKELKDYPVSLKASNYYNSFLFCAF